MGTAMLSKKKHELLLSGTVIPAHPLALTAGRRLDEERQRLLTRYYLAAGAGGVAVGVHSTQFAIRDPAVNLYERVLQLAADEIRQAGQTDRFLKVAGICGDTAQAIKEAEIARAHGYDMGLLSMGGLRGWTELQLLERTEAIAQLIPVFGFYLQPSVGGRVFSFDFWTKFVAIPNVLAIKVAAFNRYQTLDVMRAACLDKSGREIALYTGNDDNIVADLLTDYSFDIDGRTVTKYFVGGLLGQWAVGTHRAVQLLNEIKACRKSGFAGAAQLLRTGVHLTDVNAVIFDPAHDFHGCIPGIHEVLRRQGLMEGIWCLDPKETLSPGQHDEIDRIFRHYPQLLDWDFVKTFLAKEA